MQRNAEANPSGDFELFSDRIHRDFKDYELDAQNRFKPRIQTKRVNFEVLKRSLL